VRFEVFMDVRTHNMAWWIMTPSSLVNGYIGQRASRILKSEPAYSSETLGTALRTECTIIHEIKTRLLYDVILSYGAE
jgi:hypothetical protein